MFFKKIINRTKLEWQYFTKRPWSLKEVGEFWDTVDGYDKINENFIPTMKDSLFQKMNFLNQLTMILNQKIYLIFKLDQKMEQFSGINISRCKIYLC